MAKGSSTYAVNKKAGQSRPMETAYCVDAKANSQLRNLWLVILNLALALIIAGTPLAKAQNTTFVFDIPQQSADGALTALANQADISVVFDFSAISKHQANALKGTYNLHQAVELLLADTGLIHQFDRRGNLVVTIQNELGSDSMNRKKQILAAAIGASLVGGVYGSEAGGGKRVALEEIIVTAQKREQSLYDVPISILALSSEDIKAQKITDWNDLALAVPGLLTSSNGATQTLYMRGLGNLSGASSMVGIYVDEISVSSGWSVAQLDTRLHDIERVEVLHGPQGTLYGQGAMAGTIRFITKDPQLDGFGFNADIEASFTEDGTPSQQSQAVVNLPLIKDVLGLRVSGTFEHAGGWIDKASGDQKDINTQDVTNVRVKGLWHPVNALTVESTVIIHRNDYGPPFEQEDGNLTPAFDTVAEYDDQYELYNLTLSYDFDAMNLLSTSSYVNTDKSARNFGAVSGTTVAPLHVTSDPWWLISDIFTQEMRISSTGTGPLQWSFGGLYEKWEQDTGATVFLGPPGPRPSIPIFSQATNYTSESWAVFGDVSFSLTHRLEIGAGLRYFEDKRNQATQLNDVTTGTFEGDYDAVSPRFYANFDVTGNIKIYASAAKGFRSGGGATFVLISGTPKGYGPETVWTYELGAKGGLFDGRLVGDVAVFYTDYSDVVVRLLPPPPDSFFGISEINAGEAEVRGIEGSFTWQAGDNLRLGLLGTWLDSEFTSVIGTQSPKLPGDRLDFVKKYQFSIWAGFEFTWADRPGSVRMDYTQQGPAEYSSRSSVNPFFFESDVINMLNLHATWEWNDNFYLGLFGQNLLNDRGITDPVEGSGGPLPIFQHPRPRTLGVEFGMNF